MTKKYKKKQRTTENTSPDGDGLPDQFIENIENCRKNCINKIKSWVLGAQYAQSNHALINKVEKASLKYQG